MGLLSGTDQSYYEGSDYGNYQFTSLQDIISQFMTAYVGQDKIISNTSRVDVAFHAQRALAEMSFDTFKSTKAQEITVPNTLKMILPRDYVNYVKLTYTDGAGIEHIIYPTIKSSNPTSISQDDSGSYSFTNGALNTNTDSTTLSEFQSQTPVELTLNDFDYDDDMVDYNIGQRYGIDPQFAQTNGSFYIDELKGNIHFSSNLSGQTIILKYISDSLGTDEEMQVHKLAEEAMYKQILYALASSRINMPVSIINRLKKEARASKRQAKLRLSNIKLEEITQVLRGKSKRIKH
tara:strand:- start:6718 stop:7593 length:876 start_codon:yes stop_codon:yes gene_type:complete